MWKCVLLHQDGLSLFSILAAEDQAMNLVELLLFDSNRAVNSCHSHCLVSTTAAVKCSNCCKMIHQGRGRG